MEVESQIVFKRSRDRDMRIPLSKSGDALHHTIQGYFNTYRTDASCFIETSRNPSTDCDRRDLHQANAAIESDGFWRREVDGSTIRQKFARALLASYCPTLSSKNPAIASLLLSLIAQTLILDLPRAIT